MRKKSNFNTDKARGFRIKIYPTENQRLEINRNINISRSIYNLGLEMQNKSYENGKGYIKFYPLITEFSRMRNEDEDKKWLKGISVGSMRETLYNLDNAFKRFFKKQNRYPKFKSKKTCKKNFPIRSDRTHIIGKYIQVSGLDDKMILAKNHCIPENVKLHNTVISFDGYNYWFSCTIELDNDIEVYELDSDPIGIDVGIRNMITTSDGKFYKFSDCSRYEKKRKRQDKRISKDYVKYYNESLDTRTKYEDIPKSKNHYKRRLNRFKTISKIKNKRRNDIHTATKEIVSKNPSAIVIENISVREQMKDPWMRKYAPQMMYYEIHRQLKYKAANRGIPVIVADKDFASSQICSQCGCRGYLKHRIFKCSHCGYREDRDLNAAYNLRNLAYQKIPNKEGIMLSITA